MNNEKNKKRFMFREDSDASLLGGSFQVHSEAGTHGAIKKICDVKTSILIRGLFMSSSMKAAVRLGQNYVDYNRMFMNEYVEEINYLFSIVQRLILENSDEILNVRIIDNNDPSRPKVKMSHPPVIKWAKAKVHVFSDSVLCLGKIPEPGEAVERWKG